MLVWILIGLGLYFLHVMTLSVAGMIQDANLADRLRGWDNKPVWTGAAGRAQRALENYQENILYFLTLGILALVVSGTDMGRALLGAQIFVIARLLYLPVYVMGVAYARTALFLAGFFGVGMMAVAVLAGA